MLTWIRDSGCHFSISQSRLACETRSIGNQKRGEGAKSRETPEMGGLRDLGSELSLLGNSLVCGEQANMMGANKDTHTHTQTYVHWQRQRYLQVATCYLGVNHFAGSSQFSARTSTRHLKLEFRFFTSSHVASKRCKCVAPLTKSCLQLEPQLWLESDKERERELEL